MENLFLLFAAQAAVRQMRSLRSEWSNTTDRGQIDVLAAKYYIAHAAAYRWAHLAGAKIA